VALKFLSDEMAKHPQALERFEREARAASALNHPNIATVYDVGTHEGRPYLVMELVEGQPLDAKLRERRLDTGTLLDIAIQTADALDAAHAKGIVHRDVKPGNLFITARGQVKVLDFGLAKLAERAADDAGAAGSFSAGPTVDDVLTSPGVAVGTVSYMSPEQARGEELDARSDIFSLGCVIYEMAAGRRPFEGKTPAVVFHAILERDPAPVREANSGVPAKLEEIVAKSLEKDREMRYQTAAELRADLKRLKRDIELGRATSAAVPAAASAGEPTPTPPSTPAWGTLTGGAARRAAKQVPERGRNRRPLVIGLALFWAVVLAVALLIYRGGAKVQQLAVTGGGGGGAAPFSSLSVTRLTTTQNVVEAAISRDGKYLAYITISKSGQAGISIRQISTRSTVELVAPQDAELGSLAFSPDGSFVYYAQVKGSGRRANYYQIPSLGGSPRLVAANVGSDLALSFDGNKIAYGGSLPGEEKAAMLVAGIGEKPQAPRAVGKDLNVSGFSDPAWSPDGRTLAVVETRSDPSGSLAHVLTIDVSSGEAKELGTKRWRSSRGGLAWLPDGSGLLTNMQDHSGAAAQVWFVSFPDGNARQVTSDLLIHRGPLSVSGDGKSFVGIQSDATSNLWIAPRGEDKNARQITTGLDGTGGVVWTVDGKLVYVSLVTDSYQIWMTDAQGTKPRQLTSDPKYHVSPTVCRRVERAYYISDASGSQQLWSVGFEDGQVRQETNGETQFYDADCSPDGSWFAGVSAPKGSPVLAGHAGKLTRLDRESGKMSTLFDGEASLPKIAPDGKHVAFFYPQTNVHGDPAAVRVGIVSPVGGRMEKSVQLPPSAFKVFAWMPDGHGVAYVDHQGNAFNVWAQPLDGGKPKQLTHFTEGLIWNMAWSRDGKRLALARGNFTSDAVMYTSAK